MSMSPSPSQSSACMFVAGRSSGPKSPGFHVAGFVFETAFEGVTMPFAPEPDTGTAIALPDPSLFGARRSYVANVGMNFGHFVVVVHDSWVSWNGTPLVRPVPVHAPFDGCPEHSMPMPHGSLFAFRQLR